MSATPTITPCLWFDFKADEAVAHYLSIFENSRIESVSRYEGGPHAGKTITITFSLRGQRFLALNGGPQFGFTPAISMMVNCETQAEIDHFWSRLCEGGAAGRCGWLTDRYGVSWQIVPSSLGALLGGADPQARPRVMKAFMAMNKIEISALRQAGTADKGGQS